MHPAALEALFRPRRVAVVGATDAGGADTAALRNLLDNPRLEAVYPINPKRETLFDLPCYPTLTAVPGEIDTAIVCVPRRLQRCAAKRACACAARTAWG